MHGTTPEATRASVSPVAASVEPPKGLSKPELEAWRLLAPAAINAGTLVPATEDDFRELCRLRVHVDQLYEAFVKAGINEYGLKLERAYRGAVQRLEAKTRAYRIAAVGKEIVQAAPEKPQSALEKLHAQRAQLRIIK